MNATLQQAAELKKRLDTRASMVKWSTEAGFTPALHHRLICSELEFAMRHPCTRTIITGPPGMAKSTYTSKLFPPFYLANKTDEDILAVSHNKDLATGFGRAARDFIAQHHLVLGYNLSPDSRASDEWATDKGGHYYCAGWNTGIVGKRAGFGLIDDFYGTPEQVYSKSYRDKVDTTFWEGFMPRLKPYASVVILCNRMHEDDQVGRLLDATRYPTESKKWRVITLPMLAKENDPLSRAVGERLWPEWFTQEMVDTAKANPRSWSGLYQQEPTPESGNLFKREWIDSGLYSPGQLPKTLRYYAASDHAVSEFKGANRSCFIPFGVDEYGDIWILPDIFWKKAGPADAIEAMLDLAAKYKPLWWRAEKGHISKSLMPLIRRRQQERKVYFSIHEVTPVKGKDIRAQSIMGMMELGKVHFPSYASWWPDALFEMLSFTGSGDDKADDFCDCLAHIGMGVMELSNPTITRPDIEPPLYLPPALDGAWLKREAKRAQWDKKQLEYQDN